MKVLLVDDDRDLLELLVFVLRRAGFGAVSAGDGGTALALLEKEQPDLVVLDVNLGAQDGFDVLRELRRRSQTPVIMLTSRDSEDDKVRGLELGANDYLTKPFSHRELVARIRAQLRHGVGEWAAPQPAEALLEVGSLKLNVAEHMVTRDGHALALTVTEFRLLRYLMAGAGAVVPYRAILRQVWGYEESGVPDVVRVTIHRLRRKLEPDPAQPKLLRTVPGVGVILKVE